MFHQKLKTAPQNFQSLCPFFIFPIFHNVNLIQDCVEGIKNFPDGSIDASFEEGNKIMAQAGVKFK